MLESLAHAQARSAPSLAEVVGYGSTSDAHNMLAPLPSGRGIANAITDALVDAKLNADAVDYINAHGTGTELNDQVETLGVKLALGDAAHSTPISSIKGATGHAMGGSSAIEAVSCVQVLGAGVIPPTINYNEPDPDCDLDYVPNTAREVALDVVASTSLGFGGHNACVVFRAFR